MYCDAPHTPCKVLQYVLHTQNTHIPMYFYIYSSPPAPPPPSYNKCFELTLKIPHLEELRSNNSNTLYYHTHSGGMEVTALGNCYWSNMETNINSPVVPVHIFKLFVSSGTSVYYSLHIWEVTFVTMVTYSTSCSDWLCLELREKNLQRETNFKCTTKVDKSHAQHEWYTGHPRK